MTNAMIGQDLRDVILSEPEAILQDRDVMAALVAANERAMGENVVDLRSIAMSRMEARLDRLEDTHRSVIAAAYENLAGTNQVHRAVLQLLDPTGFEGFLRGLGTDVAQTLRVDCVRLVLESNRPADEPTLRCISNVVYVAEPGFVEAYLTAPWQDATRTVTLRRTRPGGAGLCGKESDAIRSEALLRLDLGAGRLPAMLALGAHDPHRFKAMQGTDLLGFFASVFERAMRRWLA